jgi:hypothetical protein
MPCQALALQPALKLPALQLAALGLPALQLSVRQLAAFRLPALQLSLPQLAIADNMRCEPGAGSNKNACPRNVRSSNASPLPSF